MKRMEDQEKRLRNMSEADFQKVRDENAKQQSQMRTMFWQRERELQQQNSSIRAEIRRNQDEISQLRARYERGRRVHFSYGGGMIIFPPE